MKKTNTIHVEASIVGTLICAPEYFAAANKVLKPQMFQNYREAYEWMHDLDVNKMMSWDVQMAASKFGDVSDLITAAEPETINAAIAFLREEYDRKQDGNIYISAAAMLEIDSPYAVREYVLTHVGENNEVEEDKQRGQELYEAWQDIESGQLGIPTCWDDFNELAGGLQRGQTGIISGTTGTGKTQKAIKLMLELAKAGHSTAFFSIELTKKQVWQRAISIESGLSMKELSNKVLDQKTGKYRLVMTAEKHQRLSDALQRIANTSFYVIDAKEATNKASMLRQKIRHYIRQYKLFAYCIDYVQLCETGIDKVDNSGNETKVLSKFAKDMSNFNKSANVVGIWLSQLNRGIIARSDRRPRNSDLMATSALENAADWILHTFRPGAYEDWEVRRYEGAKPISKYTYNGTEYNQYDCEYILSKNRAFGGKTGSWWELQENYEQPKAEPEPAAQPKYDTAVPAQAGRENLEVGEVPF